MENKKTNTKNMRIYYNIRSFMGDNSDMWGGNWIE